jgi:sec-independent protein translocase protein TatA
VDPARTYTALGFPAAWEKVICPVIGDLGTPELLIILVVVMLVFGGKKLPDLARGSGRALRIFKAEVQGLEDDVSGHDPQPRAEADSPESRPASE